MQKYAIRARESGDIISVFETLEDAKAELENFETLDKLDETYTENFYEIYDLEKEEIVY